MKAKYVHCKKEFFVAQGNESEVKQYDSTESHKAMNLRLIQISASYRITSLFVKDRTSDKLATTAS
jgi:hypothetical protein